MTKALTSRFNWDDLEYLYTNQHFSQRKISLLKGCSQSNVFLVMKYKGIKARPRIEAGERNPFFGHKHNDETKRRLARASIGNTYRRGKKQPQTIGENNPAKRPEVRAKISQNRKGISSGCGERNINWKGGASFEPYVRDFYSIRKHILERDNHTCQICGEHKYLGIHHKDEDKRNSSLDNLVTLCASCHSKLHWELHRSRKEAILV